MKIVLLCCALAIALSACCSDNDTMKQINSQALAAKARVSNCVDDASTLSASNPADAGKVKDIQQACTSVGGALANIADASGKIIQGR